MNGGAGFLRRSEVSTELTVQAAPATSSRTRIAAVSFGRRGSDPSNLSFSPSKDESRAAKRTGVVDEVAEGAGSSARVHGPVLDRDERLDLALALADDPQGDRLHAPGRKAPPDLLPEQVRDLVADEPVDDAARLLGVHEPAIDLAGGFHRGEDRLLGDLVEADAAELRLSRTGLQRLLEVPGDRLALAVGVGGEVDGVGGLGRLLELVDRLLFARRAARRTACTGARDPPRGPCAGGRGRGRRTPEP